MQPVIFQLDERLANPGDTLPIEGHLDEASYVLGQHEFALPEGIDYDLALTNAGEGILVTGMIRCRVVGTCDRCLDDAEFDIAGEVDEYYLFEEPEGEKDDDDDDIDYALVLPDDTIDLACALDTSLIMETPFVVLCKPDCKGLCPVCGENLNEVDCGHAQQVEESRRPANPFAALAGLKLDGDGADPAGDEGADAAAGGEDLPA